MIEKLLPWNLSRDKYNLNKQEIITKSLQQCKNLLEIIPQVANNKDIIMIAVKHDGNALRYALTYFQVVQN